MLMSTCSPTVRNSRGKSYLSFIEKNKGQLLSAQKKMNNVEAQISAYKTAVQNIYVNV